MKPAMYRISRQSHRPIYPSCSPGRSFSRYLPRVSAYVYHRAHHNTTISSQTIPHMEARNLGFANQLCHVRSVAEHLQQYGILKISLRFPDDSSEYLKKLLLSLHEHHGHQLPLTHSATRGWFWDVRPNATDFQTRNYRARSETMEEFPWHTDCSYEDPPPRYFALQVLQHDRFGGGTLPVMNVERLSELLSPDTRLELSRPAYQIMIPPEFIKDPAQRYILGSLLMSDESGRSNIIRFREDILMPLSRGASKALSELKQALRSVEAQSYSTIHLTSGDLPKETIIVLDNRRWLHSRNEVKDSKRHLRRVRWDAVTFQSVPK